MMPCFPVATASPKRAVGIDATGLQVPAAICSRAGTSARSSDASGRKGPRSRSQAWTRATASNVWRILAARSEEHTSELQSRLHLVCRLLLEKKKHHEAAALNTGKT